MADATDSREVFTVGGASSILHRHIHLLLAMRVSFYFHVVFFLLHWAFCTLKIPPLISQNYRPVQKGEKMPGYLPLSTPPPPAAKRFSFPCILWKNWLTPCLENPRSAAGYNFDIPFFLRQYSRENINKQVQMPGLICAPYTPTRTHTELVVRACVCVWMSVAHGSVCFTLTASTLLYTRFLPH